MLHFASLHYGGRSHAPRAYHRASPSLPHPRGKVFGCALPCPLVQRGDERGGLSRGISRISCLRKEAYRVCVPQTYRAASAAQFVPAGHDIASLRYALRHDIPSARYTPSACRDTVGADIIRPPQQRNRKIRSSPTDARYKSLRDSRYALRHDVPSARYTPSACKDTVGADIIRPP